jgi:hypothetical protein
MVTSIRRRTVHICEINGQRREIRQTKTARIFSRPRLTALLGRLLLDAPEHDNADDLRDLTERIGR